jgi:protease-4
MEIEMSLEQRAGGGAALPRRRRRSGLGLALGVGCALFLLWGLLVVLLVSLGGSGTRRGSHLAGLGSDRIAVLTVNGVIMASAERSMMGGSAGASSTAFVRQVRKAAADKGVKAILVRINSPGGTAAAAQEMYEAVMAARQKKPVVASMADMAASGGYYVASACNRIVAQRATMTGSIGVIIAGYNVSGLLKRYDVSDQAITSGKYKDAGSMTKPQSPEDRALLQSMVDNVYQQFLGDVAKGRDKKPEQIKPYADGRVLTGEQALKVGLVDELGGFWTAVAAAEKLGGLKHSEEPNLDRMERGTLFEDLLNSDSLLPAPAARPSWLPPLADGAGAAQTVGGPLWLMAPGL